MTMQYLHGKNVSIALNDAILSRSIDDKISICNAMIALLNENIWPERFARNIGLWSAKDQAKLLNSKVFILGCGGLGGYVSSFLARSGIGALKLVDHDIFEITNINRQLLCNEKTIGQYKASCLKQSLLEIGSYLDVEDICEMATIDNLPFLIDGCDIVLDCLDNLPDRFILEKISIDKQIPFVHGSVLLDEGFCFVNNGKTLRLPKLYPNLNNDNLEKMSINPIIPPAIASIMVKMAIKTILSPNFVSDTIYHLDLSSMDLDHFKWS